MLKLASSRRSVKENITKSQALDARKSLKLREKENSTNTFISSRYSCIYLQGAADVLSNATSRLKAGFFMSHKFYAFIIKLNLDYSRQSRKSGLKPHNYYILTKYCFQLLSEEKRAFICGKIKVLKLKKITQRSPL